MNNFWVWLVVGLIPYYIKKQSVRGGQLLEVRALFWSLVVCLRQNGPHQWTLRIPLIERLRK